MLHYLVLEHLQWQQHFCSSNIENLFTTDLLLTEHLNYTMLFNTDVEVHVMELGDDYIPVIPCSWFNTEEQRQFILDYR